MAIIQCDEHSTRCFRDSFSEPFIVIDHHQIPVEIFAAMLQARRQYERTHNPSYREFQIVWGGNGSSVSTSSDSSKKVEASKTVNSSIAPAEEQYVDVDQRSEIASPEASDSGTSVAKEANAEPAVANAEESNENAKTKRRRKKA